MWHWKLAANFVWGAGLAKAHCAQWATEPMPLSYLGGRRPPGQLLPLLGASCSAHAQTRGCKACSGPAWQYNRHHAEGLSSIGSLLPNNLFRTMPLFTHVELHVHLHHGAGGRHTAVNHRCLQRLSQEPEALSKSKTGITILTGPSCQWH